MGKKETKNDCTPIITLKNNALCFLGCKGAAKNNITSLFPDRFCLGGWGVKVMKNNILQSVFPGGKWVNPKAGKTWY